MKHLALAILAALYGSAALANPVVFTVIHPSQYEDGSAITAGVHTPIDCGPTPVVGDFDHGWNFYAQVNTPATDSAVVDFPVGVWYCAAHSAVVGGTAISAYSATISFEIKPFVPTEKTPKPPVLKVTLGK
jgi:hypothetical protein